MYLRDHIKLLAPNHPLMRNLSREPSLGDALFIENQESCALTTYSENPYIQVEPLGIN